MFEGTGSAGFALDAAKGLLTVESRVGFDT